MGKTWRDKPSKERQIIIKKHERGDHRKMEPYVRSKASDWDRDF